MIKFCYETGDGSNTILSNSEQTWTSFFEHGTNSNVCIYLWSNLNAWILASNEWIWNITLKTTKFTKFFIAQTQTLVFRTCSSFANLTRMPYFWLRTIHHRTLNIVWPITIWNRNQMNNCSNHSVYFHRNRPKKRDVCSLTS